MEGWVDLGSLIAARPGIEPTAARSQVQSPNHYANESLFSCIYCEWKKRCRTLVHSLPLDIQNSFSMSCFRHHLKTFTKQLFAFHPSPQPSASDLAGQWPTLRALQIHLLTYLMSGNKHAYVLGHCLVEIWTRHRPGVWQAATVMTEASCSTSFHWPCLRDQRISNWCNSVLTQWLLLLSTERRFCAKRHFNPTFLFFVTADACNQSFCEFFNIVNINTFFISKTNDDNIIQQLFWAAESHMAICFSQLFIGFPRILKSPGFFSLDFPGSGKSWKWKLKVLESTGKWRSWIADEFTGDFKINNM